MQNLGETLEQVLLNYSAQLKAVEQKQRQALTSAETVVVIALPTATRKAQEKTQSAYQRRVEQQQAIQKLYDQQWTQVAIAQELGISERTVRRYLKSPQLPPIPPRRPTFGRSLLDPYKQMFLEWWNGGIQQPKLLLFLLQQQGYRGSQRTMTRYIGQIRQAQGLPPTRVPLSQSLPQVIDPQSPPLTPRRAVCLMLKRENQRTAQEQELIAQLVAEDSDLARALNLVNTFLQMVRQQRADDFDDWLMQAIQSSFKPFQSFAAGLLEDYAAVKLSMMAQVSNGAVEGLNNRLKMLKRQMYGRAGLDLLQRRFLLAS